MPTASLTLADATCVPGETGSQAWAGHEVQICLTNSALLPDGFGDDEGWVCVRYTEHHPGANDVGWMEAEEIIEWTRASILVRLPGTYAGDDGYSPTDPSEWPTFQILVQPAATNHPHDMNAEGAIATNADIDIRKPPAIVGGGNGFPPSHS